MELPETGGVVIATARLRLRRWQASDVGPAVAMNLDPEVMRWLGGPWPEATTRGMIADVERDWDAAGRGFLPVERASDGAFVGMAGLTRLTWYPGEVEVGWRLTPGAWGHGYATEAGRAWIGFAFARHGCARVISVADLPNARSRAVMARLGMRLVEEREIEEDGERFEVAMHAVAREAWEAAGGDPR